MCAVVYIYRLLQKLRSLETSGLKLKELYKKVTYLKMFGVLFELLICIFCSRDADLKPLLHTVTAFPVSAGERPLYLLPPSDRREPR